MFSLTASPSFSERSSDSPIRLPPAREIWPYLAFSIPEDVLSKAFDDRDAVERWRSSTYSTRPQDVPYPPQWDSRSITVLPTHEDQPHPGSLFASRTLPPLRPHPHPHPQSYPLLRRLEWPSSYRPDDEGHLHSFGSQGNNRPLHQIFSSPLATSPSEGSQNQQLPPMMHDSPEGNALYDDRSPHHCLQDPTTVPPVLPNPPVTFMVPQTGPTPPAHPGSELRRRRGFRSQHPLLLPEDSPQIQCGWVGCGVQIPYNQRAISRHISTAHKRESQEMICQWEKPGGGVCGTSMQSNHLRRHTLDIHTALMIAWCESCGDAQRRDVMSRHKKSCERRKNRLPK